MREVEEAAITGRRSRIALLTRASCSFGSSESCVLYDRATKRSDPRERASVNNVIISITPMLGIPGFCSFEETAIGADRRGLTRCEVATATAGRLRSFYRFIAAN